MTDTYIAYAKRTMIGNLMGSLKDLTAVELGTALIKDMLQTTGIPVDSIDELIMGNVLQAGSGQNPARQILLRSGLSENIPAATVNKVCGSGLYAARLADQAIKIGDAEAVIAGGTENMSLAPFLMKEFRSGKKMGNSVLLDSMIHDGLWEALHDYHMGVTAENVAELREVTREDQDRFAYQSQYKAAEARKAGKFIEEIVPLYHTDRKGNVTIMESDEYMRPQTTVEQLSKLKPAFKKDGTVTAGNASGINDGAAVMLLCTKEYLNKYQLTPMAKLISHASVGIDPAYMGLGPVGALRKAAERANLSLEEIDLFEINEAFASQSIAVVRELQIPEERVNPLGGAIALGHPIGASGMRIIVTLLHEMKRRKLRYGAASLCIGGGMGEAAVFEIC